jgi:uncharacterized protein (TIRG00374 family)
MVRLILRVGLVGGLLALAAWRIDLGEVGRSFAEADYRWLLAALAIYVVSRALHAVEWQITLAKVGRAPLRGLFGALLVGTLVNALVPAGAGDLVKIQLVANRYRLPRAGLVGGRGAEAIINAVIMAIAIMVSFALPSAGFASRTVLLALAAVTAVGFFGSVLVSRRMPETLPRWRTLDRLPRRLHTSIDEHWPRFHEGLEVLRNSKLLLVTVALNVIGWGADVAISWAFGEAFGLDVPLGAYLAVTSAIAVVTTFPVTFGNAGTYEVAVLGALALYAVPAHDALAFALGTHLVSTAFNVALGLAAMAAMGVRPAEVFRLRNRGTTK